METSNTAEPLENRTRYWLRVLRPLFWWLLLVLVLYGIRTHQRWLQQTRLVYSVGLEGRPIDYGVSVKLDGADCSTEQVISLGNHDFTVSYPKAKSFTTNLFIWYGRHDLGQINLERTKGRLAIQANPPASLLIIRGPEFNMKLTNTPGMTSSVPVDRYTVEVKYPHWQDERDLSVSVDRTTDWHFAPRLGTVRIACSHGGTTFQIMAADGRMLERGELPFVLTGIPEGSYQLVAQHNGNRWEDRLTIVAGSTNAVRVEFAYGAVRLETDPPGANVTTPDGRDWGVTPLQLHELTAGSYEFTVRRRGYEPALILTDIVANQTNSFRTNLVNSSYAGAVSTARRQLVAGDYDHAQKSAAEALNIKPDDAIAVALQREITGRISLRHAAELGKGGNYTAAVKELESLISVMPDYVEAKTLLADLKQRESDKAEQLLQKRFNGPKLAFDSAIHRYSDANLFETHELKFHNNRSVKELEAALVKALETIQPAFRMTHHSLSQTGTFQLEGRQEIPGGLRKYVIAGGQPKDGETQVFFEVLEYQSHSTINVQGLLNVSRNIEFIPVHPKTIGELTDKLKAQLQEGVSNITLLIQGTVSPELLAK